MKTAKCIKYFDVRRTGIVEYTYFGFSVAFECDYASWGKLNYFIQLLLRKYFRLLNRIHQNDQSIGLKDEGRQFS